MESKKLGLVAFATLLASFVAPSQAGEGIFGWIYTLDLQPQGKFEFQQHAQLNHKQKGDYDNWLLRSELEYGVSNDIQIGGYLNFDYVNAYQNNADNETAGSDIPEDIDVTQRYKKTRFKSVSMEAIWRITNPVVDPIGFGIYVEPEIGPLVKELETRIIVQKNLMDDRLILASNFVFLVEEDGLATNWKDPERSSHFDLLLGASYRFASNWSGGFDYRYHNDFAGYFYQSSTQHAHFIGPNVHYAGSNWWGTAALRHQIGGTCHHAGEAECNDGFVNDDHGRDELIFKVGIPF